MIFKKKSLVLGLLVLSLFSFTGCSNEEDALKVFDSAMTSIKTLNLVDMAEYIDGSDTGIEQAEEYGTGITKIEDLDITKYSVVFDKLSYEVKSTQVVDRDTVKITCDITNQNLVPALVDFLGDSVGMMIDPDIYTVTISEKEMASKLEELLFKSIKNSDAELDTKEVIVVVSKRDGNWKVLPDANFVSAIFGGSDTEFEQFLENYEK